MKPEVRIFSDPQAWVEAAAGLVFQTAAERVRENGRASLALAGGATPRPLYERLGRPPFQLDPLWRSVHLFWGDERCLPWQDPDSNYGLARRSWIDRIAFPEENLHPVPVTPDGCSRSARAYEEELDRFFSAPAILKRSEGRGPGRSVFPIFDLILLGLGPDGHTASLFPGSPALQEKKRWAIPVPGSPTPPHVPRITLTLPVINQARTVLFLVAGARKLEIFSKVLQEQATPESPYPAARIRPAGNLIWMVLRESV